MAVAIPNTVTTFTSTEIFASNLEKGPIQLEVWQTKEEFHLAKRFTTIQTRFTSLFVGALELATLRSSMYHPVVWRATIPRSTHILFYLFIYCRLIGSFNILAFHRFEIPLFIVASVPRLTDIQKHCSRFRIRWNWPRSGWWFGRLSKTSSTVVNRHHQGV